MQPILKQEKFLDTQQDTQRLEDLYTKEDLYPQDFLIIHTLRNQGDYEAMLLSMPEQQRRQLLDGDWDIKEGAAFTEFDRNIHVIEPFDIPSNWVKFRACDYGYGSKSGVVWFAVAPNEQLVVYRELYVSKVLATDLADMILDAEAGDGNIKYGVLDSSLWHKRGDTGPSLAEQMIMKGLSVETVRP